MKKVILSAFAVLFAFSVANAQDFKPQKGKVTADFGLFENGIFNDSKSPLSLNGGVLKGRYFFKDDMAIRAAFGIQNESDTDTSVKNVTSKKSSSAFSLAAGIEKHFSGTDRLSPYVGADLGIVSQSSKTSVTNDTDSSLNVETKTAPIFGITGNLLFGADYYIAKSLYLGAEAGLALSYASEGKASSTLGGTTTESEKKGSAFKLGTELFAGFKIGFVF